MHAGSCGTTHLERVAEAARLLQGGTEHFVTANVGVGHGPTRKLHSLFKVRPVISAAFRSVEADLLTL